MLGVIFKRFGGPEVLEIADLAMPVVGELEILVRVHAAAVNPKDIFIRKGYFKQFSGTAFPMQTGFDFAGKVMEVGKRIQGFIPGQKVFGMLGGWSGRTCAQYVAVQPHHISPMPENLSFAEAAALPLVSLTALQALRDEAQIKAGSRICINGASGGVGSMAVQIAKRLDARVFAISSKENHALLKSLGAEVCIDYHQTDITTYGQRFDVFFDVFGNRFFETVQPILSPEGTWISTVLRPEVKAAVERTKGAAGQKARQVMVRPDTGDLGLIREWVQQGLIRPIIHGVFPMARVIAAHQQQETKHSQGKLVVEVPRE